MKSLSQSYSKGQPAISDVPPPALQPGGILVRNAASVISAGTERMMVDLAKKSLVGKARDRPDLVRKVFEKVRRDGLMAAVKTVRSRLDAPVPLGYSTAGIVTAVAEGVDTFRVGDRVACGGAGYANHAEVIFVPKHLAVQVPDAVEIDAAAFTTVGAIALQGLRLAQPELGETVVVVGLGLVGLLAAQLCRAAGCRVIGLDLDAERCRLAEQLGVELAVTESTQLVAACRERTAGHGADKILIAASTKSSQPIELASEVARSNGIVVAVGAVGMDVPRRPFYDKELTLRVSRSYGPGRYDPQYEEQGHDYPLGHVRWTENRNMQAFVQQLAAGGVDVEPLISHRFTIDDAESAYELLTGDSSEPYLGIVLTYPQDAADDGASGDRDAEPAPRAERPDAPIAGVVVQPDAPALPAAAPHDLNFGILGAGQFATGVLLPELAKIEGVGLARVCTATGIKAQSAAAKFGIKATTTEEADVLDDPEIDTVLIATRHHVHARQVLAALDAGKNVFVEKPLCLNQKELGDIEAAYAARENEGRPPCLMVGYNRRFAPMSQRLAEFCGGIKEPLVVHYRVNAGYIPTDHWTQDPEQGGGRIIGEVCHFVDYLLFLTGTLPRRVSAFALPNAGRYRDDNLVVTFEHENGSLGTVTYVANGDTALGKERIEVSGGGAFAVLDNFRRLDLMRDGRRQTLRSRLQQDKGHKAQLEAFVAAARTDQPAPISWRDTVASTRATLAILRSLRTGQPVEL
ncbi:MAG: bi-domain-containing oxidoreductase [Acidobacteriota bacterium]